MRVGLFVDGESEQQTLPEFLRRAEGLECTICGAWKLDVHPCAPIQRIQREIVKKLPIVRRRNLDALVVVLDQEVRSRSVWEDARQIALGVVEPARRAGIGKVDVVFKVAKFENWLIADVECFEKMPRAFKLPATIARTVEAGGADGIDAEHILRRAATLGYEKRGDALRILRHADAKNIERHSRSFRRFVRVLGARRYSGGSCRWIPPNSGEA